MVMKMLVLNLRVIMVEIGPACFSEMLISTRKFTWCYNTADQHGHLCHHQNLNCHSPDYVIIQ